MSRGLKIAFGVGGVLALLVSVGAVVAQQPLGVGTGYSAKRLCSEVFVAGRPEAPVIAQDLALMPLPMDMSVDREAKTATVSIAGTSQTAVWRPGLGCALSTDRHTEALRAAGFEPSAPEQDLSAVAWPEGDKLPESLPAGIDAARLGAAVERAFEEPEPARLRRTRAVVVVHRGALVAEQYAEGFTRDTPLLGWSMTKSATNALVGVLVHQGKLDIHKPAPIPEWSGTPRAAITTDQLMRMSSGLRFDETYGAFGDVTAMLFTEADAPSHAIGFDLDAVPDTRWSYSSGTSNILTLIVRRTLNDDTAYHRFPRRALFERIGAHSAVMETDPSGTFVGSSFLYMTARDWARFGLLYLQDGVWGDERILPEGWVDYTCAATPHAPKGEYGAQWWTNKGKPEGAEDRKYPSLPTDTCAAHGFETQRVIIIPSRELVVVRLGLTQERGAFDVDAFVKEILDALPAAETKP